jgi:hypothetical protein
MNRRVGWLLIALAAAGLYAAVVDGHDAPEESSEVIAKATVLRNLGTLRGSVSTGDEQRLFFDNGKGVIRMVILRRYRYADAIRALLADRPQLSRAIHTPEQ